MLARLTLASRSVALVTRPGAAGASPLAAAAARTWRQEAAAGWRLAAAPPALQARSLSSQKKHDRHGGKANPTPMESHPAAGNVIRDHLAEDLEPRMRGGGAKQRGSRGHAGTVSALDHGDDLPMGVEAVDPLAEAAAAALGAGGGARHHAAGGVDASPHGEGAPVARAHWEREDEPEAWNDRWAGQAEDPPPPEEKLYSDFLRHMDDLNDDETMMAGDIRQKKHFPKREYVQKLNAHGWAYGIGRRKRARAQAWVRPGTGRIVVNRKLAPYYFTRWQQMWDINRPFQATGTWMQFDLVASVHGGGFSGQGGAIRLAAARALQNWDPKYRKPLLQNALLTVDPRVVESKKPGFKKAHKRVQWVKR